MISYPEILNPDYYRVSSGTSMVIVQACIVGFIAGLWIALLAYRSAFRSRSSAFFWCANFSLAYALWNIFFLSAYAQRDLEVLSTSLSADIANRVYLAIAVLLPSFAHACLKRIFHARFLISNRLHFFTLSLAALSFFVPAGLSLFYFRFIAGFFSFGAFTYLTWKVWRRYQRATDLRIKTRSLFLAIGFTVSLSLTFIGQLRAEGVVPYPLPYLGNIITVAFLYFIYQMLENPRLREIRELMLKGIRVLFLTAVLSGIFASLLAWVGENNPELFIFNTFLASFIIISILEPLRKQLDRYILKKLIVDRYEFEKLIQSILRSLRRCHTMDQLLSTLSNGIRESDRIFRAGVYLWDPTTAQFRLMPKGNLNTAAVLPPEHPAIYYLQNHRSRILQEQTRNREEQGLLKEMKAHLILPLCQSEKLVGLWIMRSSLSNTNPYTSFSNAEIEQLRRLVAELEASMEQLQYFEKQDQQKRLAALGEMSAALAHEIRNPLGAIQGATQLLDSSPTLKNPEDRECVSIMKNEMDRLQKTVNQYLQYARKPEQDIPVNLGALIKRAIKASRPKAEKTKTEIHFSESERMPEIFTDSLKLEQVLINLIVNACEAFSKNIWLGVREQEKKEKAAVVIFVRDDGPGIPPQVLPNIFTPLFTTKRAGSGLGLPICKKIIDSLGGELRVNSRLDEGTSFSLFFKPGPRASVADPEISSADTSPMKGTPKNG